MELPAASRLSVCKPRPAPPLPHRAPASRCVPSSSTPCSSFRKTRRRPPSSSSQKELPDPELPPGAAPAWNNQGHGQETVVAMEPHHRPELVPRRPDPSVPNRPRPDPVFPALLRRPRPSSGSSRHGRRPPCSPLVPKAFGV